MRGGDEVEEEVATVTQRCAGQMRDFMECIRSKDLADLQQRRPACLTTGTYDASVCRAQLHRLRICLLGRDLSRTTPYEPK